MEEEKGGKIEEKKGKSGLMLDDNLLYSQYFEEFCPLKLNECEKIEHRYTVSITRAICTNEIFGIYD